MSEILRMSDILLPRLMGFMSIRCSGMTLYGENTMLAARQTKHVQRYKAAVFVLLFPLGLSHAGDGLRDCIAQARGSIAVAVCEKQAQLSLQENIKRVAWYRS